MITVSPYLLWRYYITTVEDNKRHSTHWMQSEIIVLVNNMFPFIHSFIRSCSAMSQTLYWVGGKQRHIRKIRHLILYDLHSSRRVTTIPYNKLYEHRIKCLEKRKQNTLKRVVRVMRESDQSWRDALKRLCLSKGLDVRSHQPCKEILNKSIPGGGKT